MNVRSTKNDDAWNELFEEESILKNIKRDGFYYISSKIINKKREARLMTKFDHQVQLPRIFKENNLSIQPVSRGNYIIGAFSSYFQFPEDRISPDIKYVELPSNIETLVSNYVSSESSAIMCSYLSGMLTDILGEEIIFTVFGRMSTGEFEYRIHDSRTSNSQDINVANAQCEIDGGFEGINKFAIIEAKCQSVDDFIIRQLYYPYRLWKSKLSKEVLPIFLSFSNNIFTFYVFSFPDLHQYDSIELESIHRYCIGQYEVEIADIRNILSNVEFIEQDNQTPFPQADKFERVIDLLDKLYTYTQDCPLTNEDITIEYAFDPRQTVYYVSAGVYLGLIERVDGGNLGLHFDESGQRDYAAGSKKEKS